jgi:hypothetical protein
MIRVLITKTDHPDYDKTGEIIDSEAVMVGSKQVIASVVKLDREDRTTVVLDGEYKATR